MKVLFGLLFKEIYGNTHPPEGNCQEFHITHSNSELKAKLYSISRNSRAGEKIFVSTYERDLW